MIYCVEDDENARNMILYALRAQNYQAQGFGNASSFRDALKIEIPELVLLDIMLPGEDGISILKSLRKDPHYAKIPVIMTTAKGTEFDKVTGLDLGADDYLAKPFGMMEMVSRIKAVLRRTSPDKKEKVLSAGDIIMYDAEHKVFVADRQVTLTLKEYELLRLFIRNPGRVFTRQDLLSSVWGVDFAGETRTVDVHIGTLRTKLGEAGNYIRTIRGVGYTLEVSA